MSATVVVDAGRTGCRAAAVRDGAVARPPIETSGLPLVAEERGPAAVATALAAAVTRVDPTPGVIVAGLTGLFECMSRAPEVAERLRAATGAHRVLVTGDVVTSHAGALGGDAGVVVAAGTGTVALGVTRDGTWTRVDGWGLTLGDDGSGFAIGRAGLRAAMRHHDGRGGSARLAEYAGRRYGLLDELAGKLYSAGNHARSVAAFAYDVASAARDGDVVARDIWLAAADDLARTAASAATRVHDGCHPVRVAWTGSLFDAGDLIEQPFREKLATRCEYAVPVPAHGDALDGAAHLASGRADVLLGLTVEARPA